MEPSPLLFAWAAMCCFHFSRLRVIGSSMDTLVPRGTESMTIIIISNSRMVTLIIGSIGGLLAFCVPACVWDRRFSIHDV